MKTETVWIIVGVYGAYVGHEFTRREMIYQHCRDLGIDWKAARKKGDRCVKAKLTYPKVVTNKIV